MDLYSEMRKMDEDETFCFYSIIVSLNDTDCEVMPRDWGIYSEYGRESFNKGYESLKSKGIMMKTSKGYIINPIYISTSPLFDDMKRVWDKNIQKENND